MRKILLLTTTLFVSTLAFADAPPPAMGKSNNNTLNDYYVKLEAGATIPEKIKFSDAITESGKFNAGFVGGISAGYRFNEFFRSDVTFQFRHAKLKKGTNITSSKDALNYTGMLNGYLDAHNDTIFTPYLLAGIGVGYNNVKVPINAGTAKLDKTSFVWNVGLGCLAKVYDPLSLGVLYRYIDLGEVGKGNANSTNTVKGKRWKTHEVLAELVYDL